MKDEGSALAAAEAIVGSLPAAMAAVRNVSAPLVAPELGLLHEALVLQIAAVQIGLPAQVLDDAPKAVRGLAALQRELLVDAWQGLLTSHYAAAMQPTRTIDELSVFIIAAAFSREQAAHVLQNPDKHWGIDKAHEVIKAEAERRGILAEYDTWAVQRSVDRQDLHQFAHTRGNLMFLALRLRGERFEVPVGPDFDEGKLRWIAFYFMLLAQDMVFAIGFALQDHLRNERAWSTRQREFQARWLAYCERRRTELGLQTDRRPSTTSKGIVRRAPRKGN